MSDVAPLDQVRSGMRVRTSDGKRLGAVRQVHQGETEVYLEVVLAWSPWKLWHVFMTDKYVFLPADSVIAVAGKQVEIAQDYKSAKSSTWRPPWIPQDKLVPGWVGGFSGS